MKTSVGPEALKQNGSTLEHAFPDMEAVIAQYRSLIDTTRVQHDRELDPSRREALYVHIDAFCDTLCHLNDQRAVRTPARYRSFNKLMAGR